MATPKNNLDDILRRRQETAPPSAAYPSLASGQAKASKFKPASTTSSTIPASSTSRSSFSTPGFGRKAVTAVSTSSAFKPPSKPSNPVQVPPGPSTPSVLRPAIPAKRPSPDVSHFTDGPVSPKRPRRERSPQKENLHDPSSKGKGKASASGRSPFSTPTKPKNKPVNGMGAIKPKTPSRRTHDDRSLSLDYSDLLQASMSDLQDEYSCDLDMKNDLIDLRDRYSREGRSQHTLNTLRRLQQVLQDRIDCVKAIQQAKRAGQPPTLPPPSWLPNAPAPSIAAPPPLPALQLEQTFSNSTTISTTSSSSLKETNALTESVIEIDDDDDDESHLWEGVDETLYDDVPDDAFNASSDPLSSVASSSSTGPIAVSEPLPPVSSSITPTQVSTTTSADVSMSSTVVDTSFSNFTTSTSTYASKSSTSVNEYTYIKPVKANTNWTDPKASPYYPEMLKVLKSRFGLESFRPKQEWAIAYALSGRDVLVLVPTGGGKSLCFQLPALCRSGTTRGVTVVVGPLNALIDDQVNALRTKGIDVVDLRNATDEWSINQDLRARRDEPCLLYITPEKLQANGTLRKTLDLLHDRRQIARFVVDEAHVIATWGRDFRPDYNKLSSIRKSWPGVPIMALTASATPSVATDIINILQMENTAKVTDSFNRPNLFYEVRQRPKDSVREIANWINTHHRGKTGIIYCSSREGTEIMAKKLKFEHQIEAKHFHAGMDERNKTETQQAWQEGKVKVVVATIAFGMGIDKPDVRFVIHNDVPGSLDAYYQETGRAGRDGNDSHCLFFLSFDKMQFFIKRIRDGDGTEEYKSHAEDEYRRVYDYARNDIECRRVQILRYFGQEFDAESCNKQCDVCVSSEGQEVYEEDVSVSAKEILSLADDMCQTLNLSKSTLIKVYRGSKAKDIIMYQDRQYYGAGQKINVNQVDRLVQHLMSTQYLDQVPWTTRDQQYTHLKLMTTNKAKEFVKKNEKMTLLLRRQGKPKSSAPETSKRRNTPASSSTSRPISTVGTDPWAITSSQPRKQVPPVPDAEDDIADDDDPIVVDDEADNFGTVTQTRLGPAPVVVDVSRRAGKAKVTDDDPIETDEDRKPLSGDDNSTPKTEDIQEACYRALTDLRASLSKSSGVDLTQTLDDSAVHYLSCVMPNDRPNFMQALKTMDVDYKSLDKAIIPPFLHICVSYRMKQDQRLTGSSRKPSSTATIPELHSKFDFKAP